MTATAAAMWQDMPIVAYLFAALAATAISFIRPVMGALLPGVTHAPADLVAANVVAGLIQQVGILAGPVGAGLLLAIGSPATVFAAAGVAGDHLFIAPNWAPAGLTQQPAHAADALRSAWGLTDKFVVAYSGNLGRVHDLTPVLAVAEALRDEPRIGFVFIGAGAQRAALQTEAARRGLTNVQFRPPQPRLQLAAALALGDVHLVTLLPGCERYVFPSKLAGVAAVGRPVVFIGPRDSELARLVTAPHREFGYAFERADTTAIAAALRTLAHDAAACTRLGAAAAGFAAATGTAATAAARWHAWLAPGAPAVPGPRPPTSASP
jgi:glycosyltransferase involved in cell wall biosynthesis